jgi:hypothetical protein
LQRGWDFAAPGRNEASPKLVDSLRFTQPVSFFPVFLKSTTHTLAGFDLTTHISSLLDGRRRRYQQTTPPPGPFFHCLIIQAILILNVLAGFQLEPLNLTTKVFLCNDSIFAGGN